MEQTQTDRSAAVEIRHTPRATSHNVLFRHFFQISAFINLQQSTCHKNGTF